MGKRRNQRNAHLPKYVYQKGESWIYRSYLGRENGRTLRGPTIYLCSVDSPMSALHAAYENAVGEGQGTVCWLLKKYNESPQFKQLAKKTQESYEGYTEQICKRQGRGGCFGDAQLSQISKRTIRQYLDSYPAPIAANRHIQYLKAAWNWGQERLDGIPNNPCTGVRLNKQKPRERYVTPEEYDSFKSTVRGYTPLFMELSYLCRARWSEIARMSRDDIFEEGLRVRRIKGSKGEITAWTPRLRAAVEACLAYNADAPTPITGALLIHDKSGCPIKQNTFQTAWGRAMRSWAERGNERFTFHDLKAAGYSDQQEQYAGHQSTRMHDVYNRKLRVVQPPN